MCGVSFDTHLRKSVVRKVEERPSEATEDSAASEWLAGLNEDVTKVLPGVVEFVLAN